MHDIPCGLAGIMQLAELHLHRLQGTGSRIANTINRNIACWGSRLA